jgi:hypothetical protein
MSFLGNDLQQIKVEIDKRKGDVPKAKATEESLVQADWKNQF